MASYNYLQFPTIFCGGLRVTAIAEPAAQLQLTTIAVLRTGGVAEGDRAKKENPGVLAKAGIQKA